MIERRKSAPVGSPSAVRVWVAAGAIAVLASAAAPAEAGPTRVKRAVPTCKGTGTPTIGNSRPTSLQWMIQAPFRP
jgi:hypothetical protein